MVISFFSLIVSIGSELFIYLPVNHIYDCVADRIICSFIVSFMNNAPDAERDSAAVQEFLGNMEAAFRAHSLWSGSSEEELDSAGEVSIISYHNSTNMCSLCNLRHYIFLLYYFLLRFCICLYL